MNDIDEQIIKLESSIKNNRKNCLKSNIEIQALSNNVKSYLYKLTELDFLNTKIYNVLLILFPYDKPWKKELIMNYLMNLLNKYKYLMKEETIDKYYSKLEVLKQITDIIDEIDYCFINMQNTNAIYANNLIDRLNKEQKLYKLKRKKR